MSFQVYRNENYRTDKNVFNVFNKRLIKEYAGKNTLSEEDINLLLEDADGDEELIKNAFSYADSLDEVSNYMGYLRDFIKKGGYNESIKVSLGSSEREKIVENIRENMQSDDVLESTWQFITEKEDYKDFLVYLKKTELIG